MSQKCRSLIILFYISDTPDTESVNGEEKVTVKTSSDGDYYNIKSVNSRIRVQDLQAAITEKNQKENNTFSEEYKVAIFTFSEMRVNLDLEQILNNSVEFNHFYFPEITGRKYRSMLNSAKAGEYAQEPLQNDISL
jgi:hypothetical protein